MEAQTERNGLFFICKEVKGIKFIVSIVVFVDEDNFSFFLITNALIIYWSS